MNATQKKMQKNCWNSVYNHNKYAMKLFWYLSEALLILVFCWLICAQCNCSALVYRLTTRNYKPQMVFGRLIGMSFCNSRTNFSVFFIYLFFAGWHQKSSIFFKFYSCIVWVVIIGRAVRNNVYTVARRRCSVNFVVYLLCHRNCLLWGKIFVASNYRIMLRAWKLNKHRVNAMHCNS